MYSDVQRLAKPWEFVVRQLCTAGIHVQPLECLTFLGNSKNDKKKPLVSADVQL